MSQPRTDRDIMQQALAALEEIADEVFSPYDNKLGDAILALRAALAEPEQEPVAWQGLTDEEIHRTTVVMGFNPEWTTEIGVAHAIVRNLEAKLKERNT